MTTAPKWKLIPADIWVLRLKDGLSAEIGYVWDAEYPYVWEVVRRGPGRGLAKPKRVAFGTSRTLSEAKRAAEAVIRERSQ